MDISNINLNKTAYNIESLKRKQDTNINNLVENKTATKSPIETPKTIEQQDSATARLAFLQSQIKPFNSQVKVNSKVSDIEENGTELQKSTVNHFDSDGDGIISAIEAFNFNNSKIEKTNDYIRITSPNGEVTTYENMLEDKGEEYYKQGTIPVAVVDLFTGKGLGCGDHGKSVCNILKKHNPDIAITQINVSKLKDWSPEQIAVHDYIMVNKDWDFGGKVWNSDDNNYSDLREYPNFVKFLEQYPNLKSKLKTTNDVKKFLDKNLRLDDQEEYINGFKEIKKAMNKGAEFKAVNLSSALEISYESINELCESEIGEKITPENIAKYKNQIKSIIYNNSGKEISTGRGDKSDKIEIAKIIETLDAIEDVKVPIYMAGAYRLNNYTKEAFNVYALADNAICVEAAAFKDGKMITHPICSPNSLSINPITGKKYITDSRVNDNGIIGGSSTSMSTPIALAEVLKD